MARVTQPRLFGFAWGGRTRRCGRAERDSVEVLFGNSAGNGLISTLALRSWGFARSGGLRDRPQPVSEDRDRVAGSSRSSWSANFRFGRQQTADPRTVQSRYRNLHGGECG